MELSWAVLWDLLDKVGILAGILTTVISLLVYFWTRRQSKLMEEAARKIVATNSNYKQLQQSFAQIKTQNPYFLCFSLTPHQYSIRPEVEQFIKTKIASDIKSDRILEVNRAGLDYDSLQDFVNELRNKRTYLDSVQATEVHVFFSGPIVASILLGGAFDNWKPVILYHKNQTGYEYWGILSK